MRPSLGPALAFVLLLGPCLQARAEDADSQERVQEEFTFIGWKSGACAAGFQIIREVPNSLGAAGTPTWARIGTLQWPAERKDALLNWTFQYDGDSTWNGREADTAVETLARAGYAQPGYVETLRSGFESVLGSTETFRSQGAVAAPPGFTLWRVFYSSDDACALLVQRRNASRDTYRTLLVRAVRDIRRTRAEAHVSNGVSLYRNGDLDDGQSETAAAAEMDPDYARARYQNAALLSAQGRFDDALPELKAAVRLHPAYADEARRADEFEAYRDDPRFQDALTSPE